MSTTSCVRRPLSLRAALLTTTSTAVALGLGLGLSHPAAAQEAASEDEWVLDTLQIEDRTLDTNPYAEKGVPYKARVSGDRRRTETLAETPATISVITQTAIQDSGRSDLRAIVAAQPGITIGTGENGNAFGDRYVIRGQEARSDVYIDSLRDPGMTIRESFAVEQVEISKGPNSTYAGRGASGGTINSITKQASPDYDVHRVQLGVGSDRYRRATLDSNLPISTDAAVRVNLLHAEEDVPDRAPAERTRTGVALSGWVALGDQVELLADYYGLEADGAADLGTYIVPGGGRPVADLPVYLQDEDFLSTSVDIGTLRLRWDGGVGWRVENALRHGSTENGYVLTGARGTTRSASDPAGAVPTITLSTHQGWQEVDYFVDQLNVYGDLDLGGRAHALVLGAEYSELDVLNGNYAVNNLGTRNCRTGSGAGTANFCMLDGQGAVVPNLHALLQRSIARGPYDSDYAVDTLSLYALDTVEIGERLKASVGLRWDSYDYANVLRNAQGQTTPYAYSDELWNGNAALSWQATSTGNVYLAYTTAADINGGESDVGGSCGYGGLCGTPEQVVLSKPERVANLELGSKWNLWGGKLLLSGALFQITKDDVMESVGDAYSQLGTLNTGKNRVRGIEIGATGNLGERLSVQFAATVMDAEVLEAFVANQIGKTLSNFSDQQAALQLRYQLTPQLALGGALTYQSELYAGQPDTAAAFDPATGAYAYRVPGHSVTDVFAQYAYSDTLNLRLNVGNLFDRDYYLAAYRSGAFTYIGDARNVRLTLSAEF